MNLRNIVLVSCILFTIPNKAQEKNIQEKKERTSRRGLQKIILGSATAILLCYFPARWGLQALRHEKRRGSLKVDGGKTDFSLQKTIVNGGLLASPLIPTYFLYAGCCEAGLLDAGKEYAHRIKRFITNTKDHDVAQN